MKPQILTRNDKKRGITTKSLYFRTLAMPCLNYYHELFYVNKIKIVPTNLEELLTAKSLAYWEMHDDGADRSGFILYTNCFTLEEVQRLVVVLKIKFDLNCSIHTRKDKTKQSYLIYVKADSWIKFKNLVEPHIIPHFQYKFKLICSRKKNS